MNKNKIYIKKLEISSFRSLANIILEFNDSVNTITGSNGLGKSAILDAIRFILFRKDENFKNQDNYSFVDKNGETVQKYPKIKINIQFDERQISLKTDKNKWFIDDIEFKNFDNYSNEILKIFKFNNLEQFFTFTNPFFIRNSLIDKTDKSADKKEVRNSIIGVIIAQDPTQKDNFNIIQKNNNELEQNKEKIIELTQNKRQIEQNILYLERNNQNIASWDLTEADLIDSKKANALTNDIEKYKKYSREIEILIENIKKTNHEIFNFEQEIESAKKVNNTQSIKKTNKFLLIFLFIFTLGIYYFFWIKNHNDKTNEYTIKNIDKAKEAIDRLQKQKSEDEKRKELIEKDEFFINFDHDAAIKQRESFLQIQNENSQNKKIIAQHIQFKKELEECINKINLINAKNQEINKQNNEIAFVANKILKEKLKTFTIDLFDQKDDQALKIIKNGIELKNLNSSSKNNVLIELNELLKNNTNIDTFSLIDNAESINQVFWDNESQQIITKVTNDKELILNGKNIN